MAEEIIKILEYLRGNEELIGIAKGYLVFGAVTAVIVFGIIIAVFVSVLKEFRDFPKW